MVFAASSASATDLMVMDLADQVNGQSCILNGLDLYKQSRSYQSSVDYRLTKYFGGATLSDFDQGECISSKNFKKYGYFTTKYNQVNKKSMGYQLELYVVQDGANNTLLAINDNNGKTYILKDNIRPIIDAELQGVLYDRLQDDKATSKYDLNSKNTYANFGYDTSNEYYMDWNAIECRSDKFDGYKSCYSSQNNIVVGFDGGVYSIFIKGNHYPDTVSELKIDNNKTILGKEGSFSTNMDVILDQAKNGDRLFYRTTYWPNSYRTEGSISLRGFSKLLEDMKTKHSELK